MYSSCDPIVHSRIGTRHLRSDLATMNEQGSRFSFLVFFCFSSFLLKKLSIVNFNLHNSTSTEFLSVLLCSMFLKSCILFQHINKDVFWGLITLDSMGRVFPCRGNPGQNFQKCVELDQELNGSGPRS